MSQPSKASPFSLAALVSAGRIGSLSLAVLMAFAGCQEAAQGNAEAEAEEAPPADGSTEPAAAEAAAGAEASGATLVDPDAAPREELLMVPSVDETTADALVAARPYENMLEVDQVLASEGLSDQEREAVYGRLWKPLDLNTASAEEILLIPGVGERMQHEFEEYRPYRGIAQFRREIGKYVDEEEVARLEQYVTIR